MIGTFQNCLDVLDHHAKFGDIELRAPAVAAKIWRFFVTLRLPAREGHSLNKYCVTVYSDVVLGLGPWSLVVLKDNLAVIGPVLGLEG